MTWKRFYELINPICPLCGRRCGMIPLILVATVWSAGYGIVCGAIANAEQNAKIQALRSVK